MLGLDFLQVILLIIAIIALIYHLRYEKKTWVEFYGVTQNNLDQIHKIHAHFKRKGVKCRLKNRQQTLSRMQAPQEYSAVIEIKKGEEDKADKALSEINE